MIEIPLISALSRILEHVALVYKNKKSDTKWSTTEAGFVRTSDALSSEALGLIDIMQRRRE